MISCSVFCVRKTLIGNKHFSDLYQFLIKWGVILNIRVCVSQICVSYMQDTTARTLNELCWTLRPIINLLRPRHIIEDHAILRLSKTEGNQIR